MPTRAEHQALCEDLLACFERHGFDPIEWRVKGQKQTELEIASKELYVRAFDPATHGTLEWYREFVSTRDLRLLWARQHAATYRLDALELYARCPERCPAMGVLLDYGMGRNRTTDNAYFNPGQDHIIAVNNGGTRFGDAANIQIITQFINTVKNQGTIIDAMKWIFFELKRSAISSQ